MARFWSSQIWVMPTFSPTIALDGTAGSFSGSWRGAHREIGLTRGRSARSDPSGALDRVVPRGLRRADTRGRRLVESVSIANAGARHPHGRGATLRPMIDPTPPPARPGPRQAVARRPRAHGGHLDLRRGRPPGHRDGHGRLHPSAPTPAVRPSISASRSTRSGWTRLPLPPDAWPPADLGGGPGAEMRVLDRNLAAGSRHRLEVGYRLATPDGQRRPADRLGRRRRWRFDLWMSDLHPGRYLEMWLPANLCHDRFALTVDVAVVGAGVEHAVLSNGAGPGPRRRDHPRSSTPPISPRCRPCWSSPRRPTSTCAGAGSPWPGGTTRSSC